MIKLKYFVLVVAIMIVSLLIFGKLARPVQANSVSVITPTPTGTPISDPSYEGESISAEQQEELKSVIQAYFEIRYLEIKERTVEYHLGEIFQRLAVTSRTAAVVKAEKMGLIDD
jgi:hypothetical protein